MIHFTLYTLNGVKYDDDAYEITLPTLDGEIGVLPDHMPLISVASHGAILVRKTANERDDQRDVFAISGGTILVEKNTLKVLVDEADHADELNEAEVKDAYARAEKMKAEAHDQVSLDHAQSLMDRQSVRLKVVGLKRKPRNRG